MCDLLNSERWKDVVIRRKDIEKVEKVNCYIKGSIIPGIK